MSKWLDWYNTPEGKAYYDKYLAGIPGIEADENTIKNAYYEWVNNIYETEDNIKEDISNTFNRLRWLFLIIVGFYLYSNREILKKNNKNKTKKTKD